MTRDEKKSIVRQTYPSAVSYAEHGMIMIKESPGSMLIALGKTVDEAWDNAMKFITTFNKGKIV